jgi:hypothetical protein
MFRQNETSLPIRRAMFRARVQMTGKNATVARRDVGIGRSRGTHAIELLWRHDEKALLIGVGQQNELFGTIAAPTRGNSDAILIVDRVTKIPGVESLRLRIVFHTPVDNWAILIHFPPLLTTFHANGQ